MTDDTRLWEILDPEIDVSELNEVRALYSDEIFQLEMPAVEAFAVWRKFRDLLSPIAYRPVIVGSPDGPDFVLRCLGVAIDGGEDFDEDDDFANPYQELAERMALPGCPAKPDDIIKAALEVPFPTWVAQRQDPKWWAQHYTEKAEHLEAVGEMPDLAKLYRRFAEQWRNDPPPHTGAEQYDWPDDDSQHALQEHPASVMTLSDDYRYVIAESVLMLFVPVAHGWEVPAHLLFSTMDDERPPQSHVAALKWLEETYGAELLGISDRTLDIWPQSRPQSRDEAMQLAVDINTYAVCPLTGDENTKPPQWAAYLFDSPYWSFCWP